jgi:hypothetical protein
MNAKLSPAVSATILVVVVAIIAAVMWVAANQRGPHLPTGMGGGAGGGQQSGAGPNRGPSSGAAAHGQPGKAAPEKGN